MPGKAGKPTAPAHSRPGAKAVSVTTTTGAGDGKVSPVLLHYLVCQNASHAFTMETRFLALGFRFPAGDAGQLRRPLEDRYYTTNLFIPLWRPMLLAIFPRPSDAPRADATSLFLWEPPTT